MILKPSFQAAIPSMVVFIVSIFLLAEEASGRVLGAGGLMRLVLVGSVVSR
jgi:hypothetical protein